MANYRMVLDRTFHALSDPTRRAVIEALTERGQSSVKELAEPFPIGLPTFLKHLKVLEDSGLVTTTKTGRTRSCQLRRQPLGEAEQWLAERREAVENQLDAFAAYVESIPATTEAPDEHT
ncbi:metalloregulator ArsR/SmtB family transcription factor [Micromonospora sp. NPDC051296]|uniref:ArsR/SmtB family transcription factor n=1 Tax=Micromonospora sp. NPDC051296 TaxID=3155046 RepID=UPI00343B15AD